jgi:transposase
MTAYCKFRARITKGTVADLLNDDLSIAQIAQKYGVSDFTVSRVLKDCGIRRRRGSKPIKEPKGWYRDHLSGLSLAEVAEKYGVSGRTVATWLKKPGRKAHPMGRRPLTRPSERDRQILQLIRTHTQGEVARMFGVCRQNIGYIAARWRKWAGRNLVTARKTGIGGRRLLRRGEVNGGSRGQGNIAGRG